MRLLHIIASMDPKTGGPCQGIRNLNKAMASMNIQREVVCLDSKDLPFILSETFLIHALGPNKSTWQYSKKLLPWLIENLGHYDIAVVNGIWLYHTYAVRKAVAILKKRKLNGASNKVPKLFIMPHGMLDPYFQKAHDRMFKKIRNWVYWNLIEKKNIAHADGLLFTCEIELQLAGQTFHSYHPKKEINVGYGVEDAPFLVPEMKAAFTASCPGLHDENYILFLSRIHPKKALDLLIVAYIDTYKTLSATAEVDKLPKLVIAGPGMETAYGKSLQDLLLQHPEIQSFIFFTGMLTGNAKWGALYGCEAFILPSHQENFGIAVVEALACKKPVLISNQINIWKEIINSCAGMATDDSLQGITALLKGWIYLSSEEKAAMINNTRHCFEEKFAINEAAKKFVQAFN